MSDIPYILSLILLIGGRLAFAAGERLTVRGRTPDKTILAITEGHPQSRDAYYQSLMETADRGAFWKVAGVLMMVVGGCLALGLTGWWLWQVTITLFFQTILALTF